MSAASEAQLRRFINGWNDLREADYGADYDKASHFTRERNRRRYDRGNPGDAAFKQMVKAELTGISGSRALDYVKLQQTYPDRRTWINLGGFNSLYYLQGLLCTSRQRQRVMRDALDKAAQRGSPVTKAIVAGCARARNITSRRTNNSPSNLRILAQFICNEYDNVPDEIVEAMPSDLAAQFETASA